MALTTREFAPIHQRNEWSVQQKSALKRVLDSISDGTITPQTAPTALTVSTGGTASDTLAAMTVTEPADLAAVAAQLVIIQASIKSLGTKLNAIRTELVDAGVLV